MFCLAVYVVCFVDACLASLGEEEAILVEKTVNTNTHAHS